MQILVLLHSIIYSHFWFPSLSWAPRLEYLGRNIAAHLNASLPLSPTQAPPDAQTKTKNSKFCFWWWYFVTFLIFDYVLKFWDWKTIVINEQRCSIFKISDWSQKRAFNMVIFQILQYLNKRLTVDPLLIRKANAPYWKSENYHLFYHIFYK